MEDLRNFEPRKGLPQKQRGREKVCLKTAGYFAKLIHVRTFCAKRSKFYYTFQEAFLGTLK